MTLIEKEKTEKKLVDRVVNLLAEKEILEEDYKAQIGALTAEKDTIQEQLKDYEAKKNFDAAISAFKTSTKTTINEFVGDGGIGSGMDTSRNGKCSKETGGGVIASVVDSDPFDGELLHIYIRNSIWDRELMMS